MPVSRNLRDGPHAQPLRRRLLCAALGLAFATPAAATDLTALSLEQLLDVRIVGASKYAQRQAEVAAAVSVVTRAELRAFGWHTLEQVLASLPGVHTTYDRQYMYVGMRGFGLPGDYNSRLLVTVNGNRLNDPNYDGAPFEHQLPLDLDLVERIEFIPGPGGAVYGQNAMFGVVNVVTRDGAAADGAELALAADHLQQRLSGRATWGHRFDNGTRLLLSATAMRARGQDLFVDFGDAEVQGVAKGQDGERDRQFFARVAHGGWSFDLMHGRWDKDDPTGAFFSDPLVRGQYQGDGYTLAQLQFSDDFADDRLSLSARLFAGRERYRSELSYDGAVYRFPADSAWHGGELRLLWTGWRDHKLMIGVELQDNTRLDQAALDPDDADDDLRIEGSGYRYGLYVQDEWRLGEALQATLGLRIDRNDVTGTQLSPRAALIWQAGDATTLKTMFGRAHRAPNVYERDYDDGLSQVANPALRGERIDTVELVADHRPTPHLALRASVYQWGLRDLIKLGVDEASGIPQYQSGDKVTARGIELSADRTWASGARLRGSVSLQSVQQAGGARLLNAPQRLAKLNFARPLPWAGTRLGYEWQYGSSRLSVDGSRLGGHALSRLWLAADGWLPGVELAAGIDNLFDKRYAHPAADTNWQNAIEQDGRSLRLTVKVRF